MVPGPKQQVTEPPRHDARLIALLAEALTARELVLANVELSMNALAVREGRCRTRLAKLAALSCLAPDIVQMIVEGRQPAHLTAKRLTGCELPASWEKQREFLLRTPEGGC